MKSTPSIILLTFSLLLIFSSCNKKTPELILTCGWDIVTLSDISTEVPQKIWTWKAEDSENLPGFMRNKFLTTAECKPFDNAKKILVCSSGGGVALINQENSNVLFYAAVPNAHSAELLPKNMLVAAASFSSMGNRLNLYNIDKPNRLVYSDSLYGAHGVEWDSKREILWALGTYELRSYKLNIEKASLELQSSIELPEEDGHDLRFLDDPNSLSVSTATAVWNYQIDKASFIKDALIGDEEKVKSVSYNSITKDIAYVKAGEESWWAYYIRFAGSKRVVYLPGEKIYKARWVY